MAESQQKGVFKAAGLLMVAMFLSRIFGYVRDVVIYTKFGQNYLTDAYNAAFSIPDFLYYLLVGGALSSAFIPVFSSYIATKREEDGWIVASTVFNLVLILMTIGITIGIIFTPQLINILVPGFDAKGLAYTVLLTRIMFAQSFIMALNGISQGILHSYKHFFSPALGSVLYNFSIVIVGVLLSKRFSIMGFSIGVVFGAFLSLAVQIPALIKVGLKYKPVIDLKHPGVKKILALILPVLIGLSVTHVNLFINQNLASSLPSGMISAMRAAQRIMQLPVGIFGVAVAVAVFPTLTGQAANKQTKEFKDTMSLGVRTIIFITLPSAVGIIALRMPIVRAMFEQGQFTEANTIATTYALFFYSLGLIGYSAQQVLNRVFYAIQDTKTPVIAGIITILVNIVLNFILIKPLAHGGLALAYSIAGLVNMILLLYLLRVKIGKIDGTKMLVSFMKTLIASLFMGLIVYLASIFMEHSLDMSLKLNQILQVLISIGIGTIVYIIVANLMKMEEANMASKIIMKRFKKKR
ncbi:murein biosynthesis integral membrane protein MurJ [Desulfonispora thiosulfatigenes]|nr:murein biosynthesis integral membrane protein MurJ [Desulfonispora thiosulfatigenes]